jgi:hypothetical protein
VTSAFHPTVRRGRIVLVLGLQTKKALTLATEMAIKSYESAVNTRIIEKDRMARELLTTED